ncbi:MAG: hypothetical protein C4289_10415, partial [Chloroflexota bacterium]
MQPATLSVRSTSQRIPKLQGRKEHLPWLLIRSTWLSPAMAGKVFHANLVAHTEGLRLHGVFSRSAERRAQAEADWGVRTYPTYEALLQDQQVDLVIVATPHDTHAPMAIQAVRAGKHVVTDKIMCLTLEEGRAMIEAARQAGVVFSVFH